MRPTFSRPARSPASSPRIAVDARRPPHPYSPHDPRGAPRIKPLTPAVTVFGGGGLNVCARYYATMIVLRARVTPPFF